MQFFGRKSGEQVLARGSEREKQNKRAMQLQLNAFLRFGQICYSNNNQRARCFGWPSTRLCQLHSTPRLQNSPLVFVDAVSSKPLPTAHVPSASTAVLGTPTHAILPDQKHSPPISPRSFSFTLNSGSPALRTVIDENTNAPNSLSRILQNELVP